MQIAVECRHTARESLLIMASTERFDRELARHYGSRIRRLWASAARINAGAGAGGLSIVAAKAR
jgi:hypothetical protein